MSDTTDDELREDREPAAETPQELPGRRLQQAREAAGLSRSEMAAQMRISERTIAALEEDDYDTLPSATYVSGYIRSYVRILGLPEADFVKPLHHTTEQPAIVTAIGSNGQVSSRALPVRLVTYLLVALVVVSVVMWWYTKRDMPETFTTAPQSEVAEVTAAEQPGADSAEPVLQSDASLPSLAQPG
ncbi:MAG TPA: helix-turn-helix transcriptional regulator, partial [Gammaproteobacteria bacterium]